MHIVKPASFIFMVNNLTKKKTVIHSLNEKFRENNSSVLRTEHDSFNFITCSGHVAPPAGRVRWRIKRKRLIVYNRKGNVGKIS